MDKIEVNDLWKFRYFVDMWCMLTINQNLNFEVAQKGEEGGRRRRMQRKEGAKGR